MRLTIQDLLSALLSITVVASGGGDPAGSADTADTSGRDADGLVDTATAADADTLEVAADTVAAPTPIAGQPSAHPRLGRRPSRTTSRRARPR